MYLLINKTYDPADESPDYVLIGPLPGRDHVLAMDIVRVVNSDDSGLVGWFHDLQDVLIPHEHVAFETPLEYFSKHQRMTETYLVDLETRRLPLMLERCAGLPTALARIEANLKQDKERLRLATLRAAEFA